MGPGDQQVTLNFGSLQATVPIGAKAWKIVPGSHPLPIADFDACSNSELFAPARTESELCHRPYTAFLHVSGPRVATCHLGAHLGDWPSESAKLAVRW